MHTILQWQKAIQLYRWVRGGDGREVIEVGIKKGQEEISQGDGYVHYLDSWNGLVGVCICQNIKLHSLNMSSSLYVNYTLIKLLKIKENTSL